MENKRELREIKLSSLLLRMKAYKKLQMYKEAFVDSEKLWGLMSPSEKKTNAHFQQEYIQELMILSGHDLMPGD